jgi:hypothetical protein
MTCAILRGRVVSARFGLPDVFRRHMRDAGGPELQLQVAAAYVMHPGYRQEAERRWRQSMLGWPRWMRTRDGGAPRACGRWWAGTSGLAAIRRWRVAAVIRGVATLADGLGRGRSRLRWWGMDGRRSSTRREDVWGAAEAGRRRRNSNPSAGSVSYGADAAGVRPCRRGEPALAWVFWPVTILTRTSPQAVRVLAVLAAIMRLGTEALRETGTACQRPRQRRRCIRLAT